MCLLRAGQTNMGIRDNDAVFSHCLQLLQLRDVENNTGKGSVCLYNQEGLILECELILLQGDLEASQGVPSASWSN